jgi:hypothetical protein
MSKNKRESDPFSVSLMAVISSPSGSGKNGVVGIPGHLSSKVMSTV